jgi:Tetratricopeptide repeat
MYEKSGIAPSIAEWIDASCGDNIVDWMWREVHRPFKKLTKSEIKAEVDSESRILSCEDKKFANAGFAHMLYLRYATPLFPIRFFNSALPAVIPAGASTSRELLGGGRSQSEWQCNMPLLQGSGVTRPLPSRRCWERSIPIRRRASTISLAWQGDYAGARPLLERALAIREKVLGAEMSRSMPFLPSL